MAEWPRVWDMNLDSAFWKLCEGTGNLLRQVCTSLGLIFLFKKEVEAVTVNQASFSKDLGVSPEIEATWGTASSFSLSPYNVFSKLLPPASHTPNFGYIPHPLPPFTYLLNLRLLINLLKIT